MVQAVHNGFLDCREAFSVRLVSFFYTNNRKKGILEIVIIRNGEQYVKRGIRRKEETGL